MHDQPVRCMTWFASKSSRQGSRTERLIVPRQYLDTMVQARVQTLADVLKGNSDASGVVCAGGGPTFSRGQLEGRIKFTANLLRNSGIKPGDTVSIAKANTVGGCYLSVDRRRHSCRCTTACHETY